MPVQIHQDAQDRLIELPRFDDAPAKEDTSMFRIITAPPTTEQAIDHARRMIEAARKLTQAADAVTESRGSTDREAAEVLKDARHQSYRITTAPDALTPVLEALIAAVAKSDALPTPECHLCGKRWVPTPDGEKFPACPDCKDIFENAAGTNLPG